MTTNPPTDAMIEAGVRKLTDWHLSDSINCALCVEAIYLAMQSAQVTPDERDERIKALEAGLAKCRTNYCGYNIQNFEDASLTAAAFYKEICKHDEIARNLLTNPTSAKQSLGKDDAK